MTSMTIFLCKKWMGRSVENSKRQHITVFRVHDETGRVACLDHRMSKHVVFLSILPSRWDFEDDDQFSHLNIVKVTLKRVLHRSRTTSLQGFGALGNTERREITCQLVDFSVTSRRPHIICSSFPSSIDPTPWVCLVISFFKSFRHCNLRRGPPSRCLNDLSQSIDAPSSKRRTPSNRTNCAAAVKSNRSRFGKPNAKRILQKGGESAVEMAPKCPPRAHL